MIPEYRPLFTLGRVRVSWRRQEYLRFGVFLRSVDRGINVACWPVMLAIVWGERTHRSRPFRRDWEFRRPDSTYGPLMAFAHFSPRNLAFAFDVRTAFRDNRPANVFVPGEGMTGSHVCRWDISIELGPFSGSCGWSVPRRAS
jgi:hypothetical protein